MGRGRTKLWTVPDERMKGGRQHRVPLSEPALAILRKMMPDDNVRDIGKRFVFPGNKPGRPLSNMAMLELIRRMNCEREVAGLPRWTEPEGREVVPHGFRSTFNDWATDFTPSPAEIIEAAKRGEIVEAFPRDLVEVALAHALDSKTEEASPHRDDREAPPSHEQMGRLVQQALSKRRGGAAPEGDFGRAGVTGSPWRKPQCGLIAGIRG
jgi:integrase